MVDRIATFAQSSYISRELMRMQTEYAKTSMQQSTSLKSETFQGISGDSYKLLQYQSNYDVLAAQTENAQSALDKTNQIYANISSMTELIDSMMSDLSSLLSGSDSGSTATLASNTLDELVSLLNGQMGGDYLFGGSVTDTSPVDLSAYVAQTAPSTADTSYYQGTDTLPKVRASDNLTVTYGVTANNSAFEQAIRALKLVIANPSDTASLKEAYNLLKSSSNGVATLQATLSTQASTLNNKISQNTDDMNQLDSMISDIRDSDLSEVTVKITELETQLEAAYSISNKILNLKLSDYLK